ncbi:MAG TPA: DUF2059 domain-containing protein [Allosphingosinicella sp.]|nr:DUF2059 domain-containing protein [Allosphingosinicella sp.]
MRTILLGLGLLAWGGAALAQPPEQLALGRRMAAAGDFNAIVGAMGAAEVERLARETPDLTEAERSRLREIGRATLETGRARLLVTVGAIYARHFTAAQLAEIVAFLESPAGRAYVGALPRLLPEIAQAMQGVDLAAEIRAAFCRETGKLCAAPAP